MHRGKRTAKRGVVAVSVHFEVLEHQKGVLPRFSPTERCRDPYARRGQRFETVALGGEAVRLRTLVDLREKFSPTAFEDVTAMDAASRGRRSALKPEWSGRIRDGFLQRGDELRGFDHP